MNRLSVCGKNSKEREGGGGGGGGGGEREPVDKHLRLPFRNDPVDHLPVRSLSVNKFRASATPGKINGKGAVFCFV